MLICNCLLKQGNQQLLGPVGGDGEAERDAPAVDEKREPCTEPYCSCQEPDFPHTKLSMLDEKISSPRWVVPVLPEQELEVLMLSAINLCKSGEC